MRTELTLALLTCAALTASPALFAQSKDSKYFQEMAQANMAEVQTGKLAQQKASSEDVKKFAEHMVQDHGKMLQEQQSMAKAKGVSQNASGEQFDRAYMEQMVKDHEKTLKLLQDASKNAKDPQLKQAAEKATPDVEKHLEMAKQIVEKTSR